MSDQIRVNIRHRVHNAAIKREKRNGRDVIVVPSAVAKFETVLNEILYTREELESSYLQLEGLPAPLGHPVVNNQFVSARSPEAINGFWAGAWNTNPRIEGDRVFADKVIDVEFAQNSENGRKLLAAIDAGEPISTSTGLLMERDPAPEGAEYKWIGRNYAFDHDAILLNEAPAISTGEGVGMMVNAAGEKVEVVNSELVLNEELPGSMEDMRRGLQQAAEDKYGSGYIDDFNADSIIFYQMEDDKAFKIGYGVMDGQIQISDERQEVQRKTTWEAVTNTIRNTLSKMFGSMPSAEQGADGLTANQSTGESEMTVTKEAFDALAAKVDSLVANAEKQPSVAEQITEALKPVTEQLQANAEAEKAKAAAQKATAVETVVNAKLATQEEAEALELSALTILARNAKQPRGIAGIAGGNPVTNNAVEFEAPEAI